MKTKFIKGTNKQYSIREDGILTRHYRYYRDINDNMIRKISYKDVIIKTKLNKDNHLQYCIRINGKTKNSYIATLVAEYFNVENPYSSSSFKIAYRDNNPNNCSVDNIYFTNQKGKTSYTSKEEAMSARKEQNRENQRNSYNKNKGKKKYVMRLRKNQKRYYLKLKKEDPEKVANKYNKFNKIYVNQMSDSYVAAKIGFSVKLLPEDLIELKRKQLKLHREIKKQNYDTNKQSN
jgi:hypothetical protein